MNFTAVSICPFIEVKGRVAGVDHRGDQEQGSLPSQQAGRLCLGARGVSER